MPYDYKNKQANIRKMNAYMLAKTLSMFEWGNLPDTIPRRELEKLLQTHGHAFITEVNGKLYAFAGGLGGTQDVYGNHTEITISNVALNFNKTLSLSTDGVFIRNDDCELGLLQLFDKQHTYVAENDINIMMWGYNSRSQKVISAPDDKTQQSAEEYIRRLVNGDISVIGESPFFDGVKVQGAAGANNATVSEMIELHQYLKASLNNEVGISANFNMKRERLVSSEVEQTDAGLFPLVYNMLENRLNAAGLLNEKYGLNVEVGFGSVWADKHAELVDADPTNNQPPVEQPPATSPETTPEEVPAVVPDEIPDEVPDVVPDEVIDEVIDGAGELGLGPDTDTETSENEVVEDEHGKVVEPDSAITESDNPQTLIVNPEDKEKKE